MRQRGAVRKTARQHVQAVLQAAFPRYAARAIRPRAKKFHGADLLARRALGAEIAGRRKHRSVALFSPWRNRSLFVQILLNSIACRPGSCADVDPSMIERTCNGAHQEMSVRYQP